MLAGWLTPLPVIPVTSRTSAGLLRSILEILAQALHDEGYVDLQDFRALIFETLLNGDVDL